MSSALDATARPPRGRDPLGHGSAQAALGAREFALWLGLGALLRVALAVLVTGGVLVDDAYITLRYALNGAEHGALVYNLGEPVFGVTSPLWGFVTMALAWAFGRAGLEAAVLGLGVALWTLCVRRAALITCEAAGPAAARGVLAVLLFAPVFVDNQLLGMETPLVAWLAVEALAAARAGRIRGAAAWTGLLVVARPEGVLFAPALVLLGSARSGARALARELTRPAELLLLLGPGLAWIAFALHRYGAVLPQSMLAKSGWNSAHYDALASLENAWFGVARLTFAPFVDYLPSAGAHALTASIVMLVAAVAAVNVRGGTAWSRAALLTYGVYIGFYLAGKGATEASWYAVPSSLLLTVAASPVAASSGSVGRALLQHRATAVVCAGLLAAASCVYAQRRAPLLASYEEGYGACADALEALGPPTADERVLVGEIGVFGYRTSRRLIDVGALVSPEVLPVKNRGVSLVAMARELDATWLVVSDIALERNHYPSVGRVWATPEERSWLESAELFARSRDKQLLRLAPRPRSHESSANPATRTAALERSHARRAAQR